MRNDGGIKRSGPEDDNEITVRPKAGVGHGGSGVRGSGDPANTPITGSAGSLGAESSLAGVGGTDGIDDLEGLTVMEAGDPTLGMTNVGDVGPDDWAADTGPDRSGDAGSGVATADLSDRRSTLSDDRDEHRNATSRTDNEDDGSMLRGDRARDRGDHPHQRG